MTHFHLGRVAIVSLATVTCSALLINLTDVAMGAAHTSGMLLH